VPRLHTVIDPNTKEPVDYVRVWSETLFTPEEFDELGELAKHRGKSPRQVVGELLQEPLKKLMEDWRQNAPQRAETARVARAQKVGKTPEQIAEAEQRRVEREQKRAEKAARVEQERQERVAKARAKFEEDQKKAAERAAKQRETATGGTTEAAARAEAAAPAPGSQSSPEPPRPANNLRPKVRTPQPVG